MQIRGSSDGVTPLGNSVNAQNFSERGNGMVVPETMACCRERGNDPLGYISVCPRCGGLVLMRQIEQAWHLGQCSGP